MDIEIINAVPSSSISNRAKRGKYKKAVLDNAAFIEQKIRDNGGIIAIKVSEIRSMLGAPSEYSMYAMGNRLATYLPKIKVSPGEHLGEKVFFFQFQKADE